MLGPAVADLDVEFRPIAWEDFDLVLPAAALGGAAPLIEAVHDPTSRDALDALGGYDLSRAGTITPLE